MNKKVLTLCAAMLLSGSLASVYATDVRKYADFEASGKGALAAVASVTTDGNYTFTADVALPSGIPYLVVDEDNIVIDGQGNTFTGRLVITGENVTVRNLTIKNVVTENKGSYYKNAISVVASKVTLENNTILCEVDEAAGASGMANGIVFFPTASTVAYNVVGNVIEDANVRAASDDSASSGILVAEKLTSSSVQVPTTTGSKQATIAALSSGFDFVSLAESNSIKNCMVDYEYDNWGASPATTKVYKVTPNFNKNGAVNNQAEITFMVSDSKAMNFANNAVVKFNGASSSLLAFLKDEGVKLGSQKIAVQCIDKYLLFNNAAAPDNELPSESVNADVIAKATVGVQNTYWGELSYLKSDRKSDKVVLVLQGKALKAVNEDGVYTLGDYDPSDISENNLPSQYYFTITPYEDKTNVGNYSLRLVDKYGNAFKVGNTYVTVANVSVKKNADGKFVFSQDGRTYLEMDGENVIFPESLELKAGSKYVYFDLNTEEFAVISSASASLAQKFGVAKSGEAYMQAQTLRKRFGDYFTIKIDYDKDADDVYETDLTSIFKGNLRPIGSIYYNNGKAKFIDAVDGAQGFYLVNEKNEILVASRAAEDIWSTGAFEHAYQLKLVSAKDWMLDIQNGDYNYLSWFNFVYEPGTSADKVETITEIRVGGYYNVGCYLDGQTPVLAAGNVYTGDDLRITLNPLNVVNAQEWLTQPAYYTVEVVNTNENYHNYGKVLGVQEAAEGKVGLVAAENVDLTKPEGQFAIEYKDNKYIFWNRETRWGLSIVASKLYKTEKANVFAYEGDTLLITPKTDYKAEDGFKRFTAKDLNDKTYTVAMKLLNGDSLSIVENHKDKHRLGLDEDNATEWRIAMSTVQMWDATDDLIAYAPDTVTVDVPITYYVGGKWKTTTTDYELAKYNSGIYVYNPEAILKICTYLLQNNENGEYLDGQNYAESAGNAYYVCNDTKEYATRIAFKLDGEGSVNLIPVYSNNYNYFDWIKGNHVYESDYENYAKTLYLAPEKIIGGTTSLTGVLKDADRFLATTNDLFVISEAAAPTYKKLDQGEKIILSLKDNTENVLFEDGEFAGIGNRVAHNEINPTLYADTAYVNREGNFAYQYLLGVNINRVDTTEDCGNPNHEHPRTVFTEGRFLVNMIDSAEANKDVHNNKFKFNTEYKLAFVKGYHQNDTLYFLNNADEVTSKMEVGNGDYNIAKFAFKMIDEEANEFIIETGNGYKKEVVDDFGNWVRVTKENVDPAYLRWVNGNLVVTKDINEAAHFTMETSDKEATANEEIAAGNVVVAGTNGAVVVKGAEGKNVIVSTILGKVVANEVVSSDNATIAAPAGVVVVSVDGESFKVVVK